jgi:hypothetical protein
MQNPRPAAQILTIPILHSFAKAVPPRATSDLVEYRRKRGDLTPLGHGCVPEVTAELAQVQSGTFFAPDMPPILHHPDRRETLFPCE